MMHFTGNRRVLEFLHRLARDGRLPAAVLLVGPPGIGKGTAAWSIIAQLVGGRRAGDTAGMERAHPDILRVAPQEDTEMRKTLADLLKHVHTHPATARFRPVLVEDVDQLSPPSASLLLKSLEDAPAFAKFFLTAGTRERVPPTVRSRTFIVELRPVPEAELVAALRERGTAPRLATKIARLAGGRPGVAFRMRDNPELLVRYQAWSEVVSHADVSPGRYADVISQLSDAHQAEEFLVFLQSQIHASCAAARPPPPAFLRRAREAVAMVRQHVPADLVIEYVLAARA